MSADPMIGKIRSLAARLATSILAPGHEEADRDEVFRKDLFHQLGAKGLMALPIRKEHGGMGLGSGVFMAALEEIAVVDPGMAVTISVHSGLGGGVVNRHAQDACAEEWLSQIASGKVLLAYGLTEAESGSDAAAMRTVAKRAGDSWVLTGEKMWITSGSDADLMVVYALADGDQSAPTAFLVPTDTPGVSTEKIHGKLGIRTSDTAAVVLDGARIPDTLRLGEVGRGLSLALEALDHGRLGIAAVGLGIHRAAYDSMVGYAGEREQFGKPIAGFQLIQEMIADTATDLEAGRLLVAAASAAKDGGGRFTREAAIAKLFTSEAAWRAADRCVQIHGGYGYSREFPAERYLRDARILTIFEGTSEIQRLLIGRLATGQDAFR